MPIFLVRTHLARKKDPMWKAERRPRHEDCDHRRRVFTTTAGLERTACEDCGPVTIGRASDNFLGLEIHPMESVSTS
jgi:hypothetical protein